MVPNVPIKNENPIYSAPAAKGLKRWTTLMQTMGTKGFFQFLVIINVLVSFIRFIWRHILWVYGYYRKFYSHSAGIDYRRQTDSDVYSRTVRPNYRPWSPTRHIVCNFRPTLYIVCNRLYRPTRYSVRDKNL